MKDSVLKEANMTKWFSFSVLINAAKRLILSSAFEEYADRRLIQAALDIKNKTYTPIKQKEIEQQLVQTTDKLIATNSPTGQAALQTK